MLEEYPATARERTKQSQAMPKKARTVLRANGGGVGFQMSTGSVICPAMMANVEAPKREMLRMKETKVSKSRTDCSTSGSDWRVTGCGRTGPMRGSLPLATTGCSAAWAAGRDVGDAVDMLHSRGGGLQRRQIGLLEMMCCASPS